LLFLSGLERKTTLPFSFFLFSFYFSEEELLQRARATRRIRMGEIKEGKVSGLIPRNEGFAVHYPSYPSSTSRAIQTLGGTESILKVLKQTSSKSQ
jgi:hypothetical protein